MNKISNSNDDNSSSNNDDGNDDNSSTISNNNKQQKPTGKEIYIDNKGQIDTKYNRHKI